MTGEIAFWVVMLILAVFGGWPLFGGAPNPRVQVGFSVALFVLFVLLGVAVYGDPSGR